MEQTDTTTTTTASNSLPPDSDRMIEIRRSQINLLSGTIDEANFYINEEIHFIEY
ncbi:hypothetical protein I4U23_007924 [Adineta vaga]|nr:hypothetical protein I4U23_007924 [Adineta vaga]